MIVAAIITALIHSSSATIGIVMGLGASGVLGWETALAFSLGADLGTTITSFIASLNLSKNAKRAAYAHMSFNLIGVAVMLPLFPLAIEVLKWFIGDPAVPTIVDGAETFPLVPVAVGIYSTAFNIFNTLLLFPFIGIFDRILSRIGHSAADDVEDYSTPRFLNPRHRENLSQAVPAVQQELGRYLGAAGLFLATARGLPSKPDNPLEHYVSTDILNREIRSYTAGMFRSGMPYAEADLVASLIEETDFSASLGETLHQIARRVERQPFSGVGKDLVEAAIGQVADAVRMIAPEKPAVLAAPVQAATWLARRRRAPGALSQGRRRAVAGRARGGPGPAGQRRAGLRADRAHRCRAPVGAAHPRRRGRGGPALLRRGRPGGPAGDLSPRGIRRT